MTLTKPAAALLRALQHTPKQKCGRFDTFRRSATGPDFCRQFDYITPEFEVPCDTRSASVALVGAPNSGKSSLSNALIRRRVSAVSRKLNTTRSRTSGAYTESGRQLIFWDTPGVVEKQFVKELASERRELTTAGWGAAADADIAVMVVDASRGKEYWKKCAAISGQLASVRRAVHTKGDGNDVAKGEAAELEDAARRPKDDTGLLLVLNKCDITKPRTRLLTAVEYFKNNIECFDECFDQKVYIVSAYNGRGVDDLRDVLLGMTQPGDFAVPEGTAHCDDDLELIRQHIWEKLLHSVHQEVPYRCRFENEGIVEKENGDIHVSEVIRVPHTRTVSIVIGPGGRLIQWVRDCAMKSASEVLGRKVHLKLRVAA